MKKLVICVMVLLAVQASAGGLVYSSKVRKSMPPDGTTVTSSGVEVVVSNNFVVSGIVTFQGRPVPGLAVYVVSKSRGRSYPSFTSDEGYFEIPEVPVLGSGEIYFLQVFWGKRLVFQTELSGSAGSHDLIIALN